VLAQVQAAENAAPTPPPAPNENRYLVSGVRGILGTQPAQ